MVGWVVVSAAGKLVGSRGDDSVVFSCRVCFCAGTAVPAHGNRALFLFPGRVLFTGNAGTVPVDWHIESVPFCSIRRHYRNES